MKQYSNQNGFVLITTLFMLAVLVSLLGAYFITGRVELATTRASSDSANGFYAAEAGLNLRAEQIRQIFVGYNRPTGTTPTTPDACVGGNDGAGDYLCATYDFNNHDAVTYVEEEAGNPIITTIPPGERYQNLSAQEYRYTIKSAAQNRSDKTEAQLELRFKSRLVPLFQFVAFFNKDLEILPGPAMTLNGPIHTNGNLYLNTDNTSPGLRIDGQVTTARDLYRGRKDATNCANNPVSVKDPAAYRTLPNCSGSGRRLIQQADINPYNGMIQINVPQVTVPGPEVFDASPGALYWDKADLRLVLKVDASNNPVTDATSTTGVEVRRTNDTRDDAATTQLHACTGQANSNTKAAGSAWFFDMREIRQKRVLDVDIRALLNCLRANNWFGTGKQLNDSTEGGIVFHFSVKGPNSGVNPNAYGVRLRNAATLQSTAGTPTVRGMTIVSDQGFYVFGNFNSTAKIPAAIMGDVLNVLSNSWSDASCQCTIASPTRAACDSGGRCPWASRNVAAGMTLQAAILAGTDTTGGVEGSGGHNGAYSGGLENMPRFHENWQGSGTQTFTYVGSWVSLGNPHHANGSWSGTGGGAHVYNPPTRAWSYDTSFNNAATLPPLSPRFVYLRQELFVRDFERDN